MTKIVIPPEGFPPNSTVTWCPKCSEPIHVERRSVFFDYGYVEKRIETHFRLYHPIRWWLWQRFGWKQVIA